MLACDLKLSALVLDFIKQSYIFDRDYGLIGEGGCKFDLSRTELPNDPSQQNNDAYGHTFAKQRHAENRMRSCSAHWRHFRRGEMIRVLKYIRDVDDFAFKRDAASDGLPVQLEAMIPQKIIHIWWVSIACYLPVT